MYTTKWFLSLKLEVKMTKKEKFEQDIASLDKAIEDTLTNLTVLINERKQVGQKLTALQKRG